MCLLFLLFFFSFVFLLFFFFRCQTRPVAPTRFFFRVCFARAALLACGGAAMHVTGPGLSVCYVFGCFFAI